jgi:hypothetical protein
MSGRVAPAGCRAASAVLYGTRTSRACVEQDRSDLLAVVDRGHARAMHIDQLRERNQDKAQQEAPRGPARSEQDAAPIGNAIREFHDRDDLSFGIRLIAPARATSRPTPSPGPACRPFEPTRV